MLSNEELLRFGQEHLFLNYRQPPVVMVRGEGSYLFDADGNRYLDLTGGISVTALGHAHPRVAGVIAKQAAQLGHVSNLFYNDKANALADALCSRSFGERVFFCNSGAEANETAIKLARRYFYDRKETRFEVVSALGSFHGRTLATVAATGQAKYHEGFGPLPEGFKHVIYGDIAGLEAAVTDKTALVMLEPMQGEGGVIVPPQGYLRAVRELCDRKGVLLHFDEVQSGMGRTGKWFCYEHDGVIPDTMSLAKALGGGLPLGALVSTHRIAQCLIPGTHASTFGGNPICCAAALAFIDVVEEERLLQRATEVGERLIQGLRAATNGIGWVKDVRGRGCLIGVELEGRSARPFLEALRNQRVLATVSADNVMRLAPPFNIPWQALDDGIIAIFDAFKAADKENAAVSAAGAP
jgi:acetylornithine/N-succinyldiaminopimelate aminotransferase